MKKFKLSKEFVWWVVMFFLFVEVFLFLVLGKLFLSCVYGVALLVSFYFYLKNKGLGF